VNAVGAGAPAEERPVVEGAARIVVVEDSDEDYEALTRAVEKVAPGTEVLRFTSGRMLFERELDRPPLVLILDLNLPEENGLRIIHRLRTHPDWRRVPVVILSGSTWPEDVAAAYTAGAAGYLVKPFDPADLVRQMRALWTWWGETVQPPPRLGVAAWGSGRS
jgi:two-component system response regulator